MSAGIPAQSFADLMDRELVGLPSWIQPAILPKRGVLLFGGLPKIGKSLIDLEIARSLGTGENLFGHPDFLVPQKARVLYVEKEVGEYGLQERVNKINKTANRADFASRLFYVSQDPLLMLDTSEGVKELKARLRETEANVLILDPISNMHAWDENSNTEISRLFHVLEDLRAEFVRYDLSVVITHHFSKPPKGQHAAEHDGLSMDNFRGANKWRAAPDSLITVQRGHYMPGLDWKAWNATMRFELRHGEPPEDTPVTVNQHNDLRVRYKSGESALRKNVKFYDQPAKKETPEPVATQLKLKPL